MGQASWSPGATGGGDAARRLVEAEALAARAKRLMVAVLQNMENWRERSLEIAEDAHPESRVKALSLARDLEMARISLQRLTGMKCDDT